MVSLKQLKKQLRDISDEQQRLRDQLNRNGINVENSPTGKPWYSFNSHPGNNNNEIWPQKNFSHTLKADRYYIFIYNEFNIEQICVLYRDINTIGKLYTILNRLYPKFVNRSSELLFKINGTGPSYLIKDWEKLLEPGESYKFVWRDIVLKRENNKQSAYYKPLNKKQKSFVKKYGWAVQ